MTRPCGPRVGAFFTPRSSHHPMSVLPCLNAHLHLTMPLRLVRTRTARDTIHGHGPGSIRDCTRQGGTLEAAPLRVPAAGAGRPGRDADATTLQPGVTLTTIVRGAHDPANFWTVEINIPAGSTIPTPTPRRPRCPTGRAPTRWPPHSARRASTRASRRYHPGDSRLRRRHAGLAGPGRQLATQAESDALLARIVAAGFAGASRFTGWDGSPTDRGPWRLQVLTIDPHAVPRTAPRLVRTGLEDRETTSALSRAVGATAAVNAGYFVLDPAAGAPGDPAGVGVYGGRLLSETINARPALVLRDDARRHPSSGCAGRHGRRARAGWRARRARPGARPDPQLRRPRRQPTIAPLHDFTCTDDGELVAFTPEFGPRHAAGSRARGVSTGTTGSSRCVRRAADRCLPGHRSVQATGDRVAELQAMAVVGARLGVTRGCATQRDRSSDPRARRRSSTADRCWSGTAECTSLREPTASCARPIRASTTASARNATRGRSPASTPRPHDPGHRRRTQHRQPRPQHHRDRRRRRALGMRDGINLDGGGSTTMVVGGEVINRALGRHRRAAGRRRPADPAAVTRC